MPSWVQHQLIQQAHARGRLEWRWIVHAWQSAFCWGVPGLRHRAQRYWVAQDAGEWEVLECRRCPHSAYTGQSR